MHVHQDVADVLAPFNDQVERKRFVAVAFQSLNGAVHSVEKLPQLRLRCLHPFDQTDFGLGEAAYQIRYGRDLLVVLLG